MSLSKGHWTVALAAVLALGAGAARMQGAAAPAPAAATEQAATADTKALDAKVAEIYKTKCSVCHAMRCSSVGLTGILFFKCHSLLITISPL